jgi:hypothetical protein
MLKIPRLTILLFGVYLSLSNAQIEETRGLNIRALLLASGGPTINLHAIAAETGKVAGPIVVGARGISDPVSPGARLFSFAIPDTSTKSGYRPVVEVSLPETGGDFIVLLEPAEEGFKPHVVSGKAPRFGNGSTLFFNATDVPIGAILGASKILIPPRKPLIAEAPPKGEGSWYQVAIYQQKEDGPPRVFSNTRWPYRNSSRPYVFFYRSGPSGQIAYQATPISPPSGPTQWLFQGPPAESKLLAANRVAPGQAGGGGEKAGRARALGFRALAKSRTHRRSLRDG